MILCNIKVKKLVFENRDIAKSISYDDYMFRVLMESRLFSKEDKEKILNLSHNELEEYFSFYIKEITRYNFKILK